MWRENEKWHFDAHSCHGISTFSSISLSPLSPGNELWLARCQPVILLPFHFLPFSDILYGCFSFSFTGGQRNSTSWFAADWNAIAYEQFQDTLGMFIVLLLPVTWSRFCVARKKALGLSRHPLPCNDRVNCWLLLLFS